MLLVVCDFDGTAAASNVAHLLLERFSGPDRERHERNYRSGGISFRVYQEHAFNSVSEDLERLQAHVRGNVELRDGLREAVSATRQAGGDFWIVSSGLDFYIQPLLEQNGITDVRVISGQCSGDRAPLTYAYPYAQRDCDVWAVCKCHPVREAQSQGKHVIFVGDGLGADPCAARLADTVFARDKLLAHCRENGVAAIEFEDFHPIARYISELTATGSKH